MIYQNVQKENPQNQFSNALKKLQFGKLMRKSNMSRGRRTPHKTARVAFPHTALYKSNCSTVIHKH